MDATPGERLRRPRLPDPARLAGGPHQAGGAAHAVGIHEEPLRSHPAAPHHREVHEPQGDPAHPRLRGAPRRHQARDQEGGGDALRREGRKTCAWPTSTAR